jgi:two-component system LytT family response regulator
VLRATLSQLERQLDPAHFLRIHRSLIVNVQQVKELHPWAHGEFLLTLHDGTHLSSSRSYSEGVQQFLRQFIS